MKRGFSMIELIFVIVILGILAGIAIPRLAGTTTDAQISAAAANIRTLISDAAAYYAVKDGFGTGDTSTKWNEITNVSLKLQKADGTATTTDGIIKIGGKDCIRLRIQNGDDNIPAHILVAKDSKNKNSGACKQVLASAPLKAYFDSRVAGVNNLGADRGAIPIGSIPEELVAPVAVAAAAPVAAPVAVAAAAPKPAPAVAAATPPVVASAPPPAKPVAPAPAAPAVAATPPVVASAPAPTAQKPAATRPVATRPSAPKPTAQPTAPYSAAAPNGTVIKGTGSGSSLNPGLAKNLLNIQQGKPGRGSGGSVATPAAQAAAQAAATKEWKESGQRENHMELFKETLKQQQQTGVQPSGTRPRGVAPIGKR